MKAEAQRIAIAEFCGWKPGVANVGPKHEKVGGYWYGGRFHVRDPGEYPFPDYLNCRNAMAKALQQLDDDEWLEYMMRLLDITHTLGTAGKWTTARALLESTPAQQAEAFLQAKGKWTEGSE